MVSDQGKPTARSKKPKMAVRPTESVFFFRSNSGQSLPSRLTVEIVLVLFWTEMFGKEAPPKKSARPLNVAIFIKRLTPRRTSPTTNKLCETQSLSLSFLTFVTRHQPLRLYGRQRFKHGREKEKKNGKREKTSL